MCSYCFKYTAIAIDVDVDVDVNGCRNYFQRDGEDLLSFRIEIRKLWSHSCYMIGGFLMNCFGCFYRVM